MHSKGIMHRDLKPANILLRTEYNWNCVVADFGLAEFENSSEYLFKRCGTPGYVAPEVIGMTDSKYNGKCDIFSVGVILYQLLFCKGLFRGTDYDMVYELNRNYNREVYDNLFEDIYRRVRTPEIENYMISLGLTSADEVYKSLELLNRAKLLKSDDMLEALDILRTLDLLKMMLVPEPEKRVSAKNALEHEFFKTTEWKRECFIKEDNLSASSRNSIRVSVDFSNFRPRDSFQCNHNQNLLTGVDSTIN